MLRIRLCYIAIVFTAMLLYGCHAQTTGMLKQNAIANFQQGQYRLAIPQFKKLALTGDLQSQYTLGYMYFYGLGIGRDEDLARYWIHRTAVRNFPAGRKAYLLITDKYWLTDDRNLLTHDQAFTLPEPTTPYRGKNSLPRRNHS